VESFFDFTFFLILEPESSRKKIFIGFGKLWKLSSVVENLGIQEKAFFVEKLPSLLTECHPRSCTGLTLSGNLEMSGNLAKVMGKARSREKVGKFVLSGNLIVAS